VAPRDRWQNAAWVVALWFLTDPKAGW